MKKQTEGFLRDSVKANLAKTRVTAINNAELEGIKVAQVELYREIDELKKELDARSCALLEANENIYTSIRQVARDSTKKADNLFKILIVSQAVVLVTVIILAIWA